MNIKELIEKFASGGSPVEIINEADFSRELSCVYCCDLLSVVMGKAPADCAWVTVMGNLNSVAVSVLADISLIVIAENSPIDQNAIDKAREKEVNIIKTKLPIFDMATKIDFWLKK
ncbi:MAG: hypothetical protein FWH05_05690 [Oscillospiraceae bacterium]|nr:hypothetical protein [Oscillospiraceae bacterium]